MCKQEQSYGCPICLNTLQSIECVSTTCGHVFHRQCILDSIDINGCCFVCNKSIRNDGLKKIYLSELNQSIATPYISEVLDKSDTLTDRLSILKKRFSVFEDDVEPIIQDLGEILEDLNEKIDFFQEIHDQNENLDHDLKKYSKAFEKMCKKRKVDYENILKDNCDHDVAIKNMEIDIKLAMETTRLAYTTRIREWKNFLLTQLDESSDKCELIIKIGYEPRRYIKETFEKFANRLYQFEN